MPTVSITLESISVNNLAQKVIKMCQKVTAIYPSDDIHAFAMCLGLLKRSCQSEERRCQIRQ